MLESLVSEPGVSMAEAPLTFPPWTTSPPGIRALGRLTRPREVDGKTVQGINFFAPADKLHALQNPRVNIAGIRRSQLLPHLGMFSPTRLSRHLRRLLDLGVLKRVTGTYRYYLTKAGRAATAAAERITEAVIIPATI